MFSMFPADFKKHRICFVLAIVIFLCISQIPVRKMFTENKNMPQLSALRTASRVNELERKLVPSEAGASNQDARITHLKQMCLNPDLFHNWIYRGKHSVELYYSNRFNFSYCKVPKVGSTFWTRTFSILEDENESNWQELLDKQQVHMPLWDFIVPFQSEKRRNSRTVIMSRNPYSRLYSAYVGKIYRPPHALQTSLDIRPKRNPANQVRCAQPASFLQFLRAVISQTLSGATLNRHWAPVVSLCRPCDTKYVQPVLLNFGSFSDDFRYIMNAFNIDENRTRFLEESLHNTSTRVGIKHGLKLCKAKLLWRTLQIRGDIDGEVEFPHQEELTPFIFSRNLRKHKLNATRRRQQRRDFLVSAYKDIDNETISFIQQLYYPDFLLFGYHLEPPR